MTTQSKTLLARAEEKAQNAKITAFELKLKKLFESVEDKLSGVVCLELEQFKNGLQFATEALHADIVDENATIQGKYGFVLDHAKSTIEGTMLFEDAIILRSDDGLPYSLVFDCFVAAVEKKLKDIENKGSFQWLLNNFMSASIYGALFEIVNKSQDGKLFSILEHYLEAKKQINEENDRNAAIKHFIQNFNEIFLAGENFKALRNCEKMEEKANLTISSIVEVAFSEQVLHMLTEIDALIARLGIKENELAIVKNGEIYFTVDI